MHREGHVGMALLAYSPIALFTTAAGYTDLAIGGAIAAGALAMVPDLDMRVPFVEHRGPTHTAWFTVLAGSLASVLGLVAGLSRGALAGVGIGLFAGGVVSLTLASHLAADALTPMGIQPWTPHSNQKISLDLFTAANPIANYALLGIGVVSLAAGYAAGDALAGFA
jgi:inner membrane protein